MLLPTPPSSTLDLILRQLTEEQRRMVLAFARFLIHDNERRAAAGGAAGEEAAPPPMEAKVAPRPEGELPVHTLKRMKRGYPMLSGDKLLGRAAELMMRHHVAGHDRQEVVEQIEALFATEYEQWRKGPA